MGVPEDAGARFSVQAALQRQLVSELSDGPGERTGRQWRLLAMRYAGHDSRAGAVVFPDHALCGRVARSDRTSDRLARESSDDAAELDREVRGRAREVRTRRITGID